MDKIQTVLQLLCARLNASLGEGAPGETDWLVLSNLADTSGTVYESLKNKLVLFVSNIEHETSMSQPARSMPFGDQYATVAPSVFINLYLILYANFTDVNYPAGLGMISRAITFFQENNRLDRALMPALDPEVDRLTFELVNLDAGQWSQTLGLAGVNYLPAVCYKMRMLPFRSDALRAVFPPVANLTAPGGKPAEK